jgi:tRNA (guanine9-N1)-methyltransferase
MLQVYIVGGIVDRTVNKGLTMNLAKDYNLQTRRLPIQELVPDRQSHILNIDQVVKILCTYLECGDWHKSIVAHMPIRRQLRNRIKRKNIANYSPALDEDMEGEEEESEEESENDDQLTEEDTKTKHIADTIVDDA